ncbi:MAG: DUF599 domain-containing protein [Rhodobacteraceae bacterium]|nr:DUF599 domain-containing protein [Paracoccaceae bacterium]
MPPILAQLIAPFGMWDGIALALLLLGWPLIGYWVEHEGKRRSTHSLIADYRRRWMQEMLHRENRVLDANILATLRQGAAFFTSASMIGIGGSVALLGKTDALQSIAVDISTDLYAPKMVWETKLMLVVLILASAFLKFVWSHRLFGYCAVMLAAVPNDADHPDGVRYAEKSAMLNTYAARSFNRGLRAMYFALAALSWLLGAWPMIVVTLFTLAVLYRREFNSQSRAALLDI